MSLESADPHDSDVLREKIGSWKKIVNNALFVVYDLSPFFIKRFLMPKRVDFP